MEMTDEKLYFLCKRYGEISLKYRRKFVGLLPEVYKRELFKKKGFGSIFEFAAKLAGVSEEQVRLTLNLEKRFQEMPALHSVLVNGQVSVNKLARVVSIATEANQEFLATQVKVLPKSAIDTLVRDEKFYKTHGDLPVHSNPSQNSENATGRFSNVNFIGKSASNVIQSLSKDELSISEEVYVKLLELQNRGIDINNLLLEFLQKREIEIAQKKEKIASYSKPTNSRYIPSTTRELLQEEFGTKCSIESCYREADTIHHAQRFAMARNHNPKFLAPLCEEHHAIAHSIDVRIQEKKYR